MENFIEVKKIIREKNPKLAKFLPGFIVKYIERILHQREINEFIHQNGHLKNEAFCTAVIDYLNIKISVFGKENIPQKGGVTLAMNHPLGGMDALALVSALKDYRQDLKFIVNDLLLHLEPLKGLFVGVNKHGKNSENTYKSIDDLFESDNVVCIFPAGMVSRKTKGKVRDLPWKKTYVTLSKKVGNLIIPVYIDGKLSRFFYNLANIRKKSGLKANIEMLYLSNELFKQRNQHFKFYVGKPIQIDDSKTIVQWNEYIRNELYALEKN